ncbi:MAG: transposase [Candidatus Omnitrophica bacterium]|nr:transposase [Candidatus Omnitrophota bacterium]MBU4468668.1 transposase [Candidatus Omnitrophota bacterium]MCG2707782.1 transposase [Candidatus Omnitrophota bacterium]
MARMARVVIPGIPHHIIQRGNRRQPVFFSDDDRKAYLDYLYLHAKPAGISIWAYCLMDNHVHLIAVPKQETSFADGFSESQKRYSRRINFRENWRGHLWEGRFKSYPLSEPHLYSAIRYVERNPVRAKIVKHAWDYPWSSAKIHAEKGNDKIVDRNFVSDEIKNWADYLSEEDDEKDLTLLRNHCNTGRPLGDKSFIDLLEAISGRKLHRQKPGPKTHDD